MCTDKTCGTLHDVCCSNWYFGPLKHRLAYVVSALRYWPPAYKAEMTYTLACEGCSRCYAPPPKPQWRWWHVFLPPRVEGLLSVIYVEMNVI